MHTRPLKIPCFEIADTHELGWWRAIVCDVHTAAGYTAVRARFSCAGSSSISWIKDAEVFGNPTVAPIDAQMQLADALQASSFE
jgi:hypothetical protein